jgi:predicted RND superfamily exporter protein
MKILEWVIEKTTTHPKSTLVVAFFITALAFVPVSNFSIDTDIKGMFESSDPNVLLMEEINDRFGEQELVTIVVDCSKSDPQSAESYIEKIVEKLKEDGRFKNIQYTNNISFAGGKEILYLPEEYLSMLLDPNITLEMINEYHHTLTDQRYIVSENGEIYLINMGITAELRNPEKREVLFDDLGELLEETKKEADEYSDLIVGFTGGMMIIDYEGDKLAMGDFFLTVGITLILILLLLLFSFRSISLPVLAVIPLIVSIIWTTGIAFLLYDSLSMLSIAFAALILGLGVDFSIHLLTRFMGEMEDHNEIITAFTHTFIHTGKAVIIGCLTTVTAFFSLTFAEMEVLHQMGIVAGIGMLSTLVAVFTLLPAIVALRIGPGTTKKMAEFRIFKKIGSGIQRYASVVAIGMILIAVAFAAKAQDAELNNNMYDMMPKEIESYRLLDKVKEQFEYNQDFLVCMVDSEEELIRSVSAFQSMEEVLEVESILSYLPSNQEEKIEIIMHALVVHPEFDHLIPIEPVEYSDLSISTHWISDDGMFLIKITPAGELYSDTYQEMLVEELRQITSTVTGDSIVFTTLIKTITDDIIRVSLLAVALIFGIVYIGFNRLNPIYAVLSLVPVSFGILGLLGTYRFFNADLNFFTIGMIPIIVGIGIDDGIHIIHRYLEEGAHSIPRVIQLTGKAIFLTTGTTVLAFSSFLISAHPSMRFLGRVPIIGISLCFVGAVLLLPALLRILVDRKGDVNE